MSLEFELWPSAAVHRFGEEVREAASPARVLAPGDAESINRRIRDAYPEWAEGHRASFLEHVLANVEVVVAAPKTDGADEEASDPDRAQPVPRPAAARARRAAPAARSPRWKKAVVVDGVRRIAATAGDDGKQMILAIQVPDGHGLPEEPLVRRTLWRPEGPVGFWYSMGAPPPTEWRQKTAQEQEWEAASFTAGGPKAPWMERRPAVEIPHDLTSLAAVARTADDRTVMVATPAGECFVRRWVRGEWDPRFSRLTPLDSIVDIAASSAGAEHEEIFAVTARGSVHSTYSIAGGEWTRWTHFPFPEGPRVIGVATASRCAGQQELIVLGYDGRLFHRWRVADSGWQPEGWSDLGVVPGARRIAAGGSPGGLIVFVATAVSLHLRRYSTHLQGWEEWATIGPLPNGGDVADVAVVRDPDDSSATLIVLMQDGSLHRLATGYTNPR